MHALITFARPEESRAFRRRLRGEQVGAVEVTVAHTGIGAEAARRTLTALLERHGPHIVIGAGFAGGLDPKLRMGDVIVEEPGGKGSRIISRARPVETVGEKAWLFAETCAEIVDMETETLAAVCASAGVSFVAVRAVSDAADTALPVPFDVWFNVARQRARPFALLGFLLSHPARIAPFARFVRAIPRVSEALALAVKATVCALGNH